MRSFESPHLYAETLLNPGLGVSFQWRYQNNGRHLLAVLDPESPVHGALGQAIDRFENTVFELALDKPTLIEWANSQETLEDAADRRELRLSSRLDPYPLWLRRLDALPEACLTAPTDSPVAAAAR